MNANRNTRRRAYAPTGYGITFFERDGAVRVNTEHGAGLKDDLCLRPAC